MEGDVWNTKQIIFITGPKPHSGIGVRDFFFRVEIGKQDAAVRRREEYKNVPEAVHVGKVNRLPEVAEHAVAQPRCKCNDPHKAATHAHVVDSRRGASFQFEHKKCCGWYPEDEENNAVDCRRDESETGGEEGETQHEGLEPLSAPVENRRHVPLWVPESEGGHEHPDDGYLVKQLTHKAQGAVEVHGPETNDHQKSPHNVDSSTDTAGIWPKEIDENRRYDEEQGIAERIPEFRHTGRDLVVRFTPVNLRASPRKAMHRKMAHDDN